MRDTMPTTAAPHIDFTNSISDEALESLGINAPAELARRLLAGEIRPFDATFGVEFLGMHCKDGELATRTLLALLAREPAQLREGVVYGLRWHLTAEVGAALAARLAVEPSPGVRAAIEGTLARSAVEA